MMIAAPPTIEPRIALAVEGEGKPTTRLRVEDVLDANA